MRLPELIVLGGVEPRRQRNTYYNKWEDEWACDMLYVAVGMWEETK